MNVDHILGERSHRLERTRSAASWLWSLLIHGAVVAVVWFVPELLAKPPEPIEYVPVMVVTPAMLGAEQPEPPPPTPRPEPEPEPVEPPPPEPEPEPEPIAEDTMVLPSEKPKPVEETKPPPRRRPPPPPAPVKPPPKREGSPFGSTMGASTSKAQVGAEDPNFTYGFYLDRVVALISANWNRPPIAGVEHAVLYFRIQRDGKITDLRIATTSGSEAFDDAAFRAVSATSPLLPLPSGYKKDSLGINLIVK